MHCTIANQIQIKEFRRNESINANHVNIAAK
jgi:hypothetical protein